MRRGASSSSIATGATAPLGNVGATACAGAGVDFGLTFSTTTGVAGATAASTWGRALFERWTMTAVVPRPTNTAAASPIFNMVDPSEGGEASTRDTPTTGSAASTAATR